MRLRPVEEESQRLSPEEARAFLMVHAEREAATPDAPTVGELAEFLNLPPEEAQAILREARRRVGTASPIRDVRRVSHLPLILGAVCGLAFLTMILGRSSEPGVMVSDTSDTTVATAEPLSADATAMPAWNIPDGFAVTVGTAQSQISTEGSPAKFGTDYRKLDAAQTAQLQGRLADGTVALLESEMSEGEEHWRRAKALLVHLRFGNGETVSMGVPLEPFTLPFADNPEGKADLQKRLRRVYAAKWKQILGDRP